MAMARLSVFNLVTLDGYFTGDGGDISWHNVDAEFNKFAEQTANSGNTLLFGRVTYELMVSYWSTQEAIKNDPIVAHGMNSASKIVFSRTLGNVHWNNTRLVKDNIIDEIRRLKHQSEKDMTILGSGSIIVQLAPFGLIDEYEIMLNPVAIGKGRTMFEGIKNRLTMKLTKTRTFGNGNVLLCYEPVR
jgi:dihydrofolate reductase